MLGMPWVVLACWVSGDWGETRVGHCFWALCWGLGLVWMAYGYSAWRAVPAPDPVWREAPPREVTMQLRVLRPFERDAESRFRAGIAQVEQAAYPSENLAGQRVSYFLFAPGEHFGRGSRLLARGVISRVEVSGGFGEYLQSQDVAFLLRQGAIQSEQNLSPWQDNLAKQREAWTHWLRAGSEDTAMDRHGRAFAGMILGRRALLPETERSRFLRSGVMHLFAISGLHVMAMAMTLEITLALLRVPRRIRPIPGLLLLLVYVLVTGAAPSAVRAFLMVLFFWSARAWRRQHGSLAALSASAVVVLLLEPRQLWSPGFQLSYAVVGSILLLGLPLARASRKPGNLTEEDLEFAPEEGRWRGWIRDVKQRLRDLFAISLAASAGSAPLVLASFSVFTPGAVLLNMLLVPMAGLVVVTGFLVILSNLFGLGGLGWFFNHAAWLLLEIKLRLIDLFLRIPGLFWERELRFPDAAGGIAITWILFLVVVRLCPWRAHPHRILWIGILILFSGLFLCSIPVAS